MIEKAKEYVKNLMAGDPSGHDYFHTLRVLNLALTIAGQEQDADLETVQLIALLHDVDDHKLSPQTHENLDNARNFLLDNGVEADKMEIILESIRNLSFKGTGKTVPASLEGKIVQDADRLDAIGAIGIARTFAYGGSHGTPMHDPGIPPRIGMTTEEYRSHKGTSLNHFYEKLFRLKETLNTHTAKEMALHRDAFLHRFVEEFLAEWDGIR